MVWLASLACIFIANIFAANFAPRACKYHSRRTLNCAESERKRNSRVTLINLWLWHEYLNCVCTVANERTYTNSILEVKWSKTKHEKENKKLISAKTNCCSKTGSSNEIFILIFDRITNQNKNLSRQHPTTAAAAATWPFMQDQERDFCERARARDRIALISWQFGICSMFMRMSDAIFGKNCARNVYLKIEFISFEVARGLKSEQQRHHLSLYLISTSTTHKYDRIPKCLNAFDVLARRRLNLSAIVRWCGSKAIVYGLDRNHSEALGTGTSAYFFAQFNQQFSRLPFTSPPGPRLCVCVSNALCIAFRFLKRKQKPKKNRKINEVMFCVMLSASPLLYFGFSGFCVLIQLLFSFSSFMQIRLVKCGEFYWTNRK